MIQILIVDDNADKATRIRQVLLAIPDISDSNIHLASDLISAKRELQRTQFDLLILDIQIPNRFDQTPLVNGGINFLRELELSQNLYLPSHIIGITAYEECLIDAKEPFARRLWAVVKYELSSSEWTTQLQSKARYLVALKKTQQKPSSYNFDVAILCALHKVELESVLNLGWEWEETESPGDPTIYYLGKTKQKGKVINVVAAAAPQMGMAAASVLTTKIIFQFRPRYVAMVGIAAGVRDKVGFGDILVVDQSWDYGSGKVVSEDGEQILVPDPLPLRIDSSVREQFNAMSLDTKCLGRISAGWPGNKPDRELKIHVGSVASGSSVIADIEVVKSLLKHNRKLLGIEMETYGVYLAARNCPDPKPTVFSIKSVSDFADKKKKDDYQKYAAYTSVALLSEFVSHWL